MAVRVQESDFDVTAELALLTAGKPGVGAVVSFVGLVRDLSDGAAVAEMTLQHYAGMTERALGAIEREARSRWPLEATVIIHRYGRLAVSDQIVLVITASAHRQAAFESCAFLVDWLKTKAPFWKSETTPDGPRWVEARAEDDGAARRWQTPEA